MASWKAETDFSTAAYGAAVAMATCSDERHPPEDAINGNPQDFWVTTGCYPQEIVIQLPHSVKAQLITVETVNGKIIYDVDHNASGTVIETGPACSKGCSI